MTDNIEDHSKTGNKLGPLSLGKHGVQKLPTYQERNQCSTSNTIMINSFTMRRKAQTFISRRASVTFEQRRTFLASVANRAVGGSHCEIQHSKCCRSHESPIRCFVQQNLFRFITNGERRTFISQQTSLLRLSS